MLSGGKAGLVSIDILRKEQEENRRRDKHNQPLEGLVHLFSFKKMSFDLSFSAECILQLLTDVIVVVMSNNTFYIKMTIYAHFLTVTRSITQCRDGVPRQKWEKKGFGFRARGTEEESWRKGS